jgi:hypothetical protein
MAADVSADRLNPPPTEFIDDDIGLAAEPPSAATGREGTAQPVEAGHEEGQYFEEYRRPQLKPLPARRRQTRRQKSADAVSDYVILFAALGIIALLWLGLVGLTFLLPEGRWVITFVGGVATLIGRRWFLQVAAEDGSGTWLACLFIPFYSTYYFFCHLSETLKPFLVSVAGYLFLGTGIVLFVVQGFRAQPAGDITDFGDRTAADGPKETDAALARLLAGSNQAEARAWLQDMSQRHSIFKWSRQEALKLVDDLYQRGAKGVHVVNIESDPRWGELTAQLVVELPKEAEKRKRLFDKMVEFESEPDRGQSYVLLNLD